MLLYLRQGFLILQAVLLLIDKPTGMTSHDVVDRVRELTGADKVGHGGTLDPNATGLLIIGVTREGTKQLGLFQRDSQKTYKARIFLGEQTDTLDAVGETVAMSDTEPLSQKVVAEAVASFVGQQKQVPPVHSAVRVNGGRAYKKARSGNDPQVPPRIVEIASITIDNYDFPHLDITTTVSSGTYIRSLARDIGDELGCGAYLKKLRRIRIEDFSIDDANPLEDITTENWRSLTVSQ